MNKFFENKGNINMTEEIIKLLQTKVELENQRLQYQDSKLLELASKETNILYTKIWEKIIIFFNKEIKRYERKI